MEVLVLVDRFPYFFPPIAVDFLSRFLTEDVIFSPSSTGPMVFPAFSGFEFTFA